jgi:hypothetical protein
VSLLQLACELVREAQPTQPHRVLADPKPTPKGTPLVPILVTPQPWGVSNWPHGETHGAFHRCKARRRPR